MANNVSEDFSPARERIHEIIFEADTQEGRLFDIVLMVAILSSVLVVCLESVPVYAAKFGPLFKSVEWIFTIFFTIEYGLRLYAVHRPIKYATSFFGVVDLLAILPTFIAIIFSGAQSLMIVRGLRLLRVFRIFKLANFLSEGEVIVSALKSSRDKIVVFVTFILIMVSIFGSIMYLVEGGPNEQFDSIPRSIYWSIVTLTTVGYGDISPVTPLGQFIAAIIMISGYAIIAVPTGIVTAEAMNRADRKEKKQKKIQLSTQVCRYCSKDGHDEDAVHCKYCGEKLNADNLLSRED